MVFTTEGFFEVAIKSWPRVGFELMTNEFCLDALTD